MTLADQETVNIYDEMYGEGDDDLLPLERGRVSLRSLGGDDNNPDGKYAYSRINALQAEIKFNALYNFIKDYLPKNHKTKVLVNGLVRLCQDMLNAEANRRQLRFDIEEARAAYWASRLGKDKKDFLDQADTLMDLWGGADLLQVDIRYRRLRYDLPAVEHERPRWHTATRKKELLEQMATKLPQPAYQVFQARKEQYAIMQELAEDRAQGIPAQDFSNLIVRIQEGKATEAEIIMDAPWPFYEAFQVCVQEADVNNPHWSHIRQLQANTAMAMAGRRRRSWGARDSDDDDP